jgi:P2 family phage contractile tail tube protein
MSTTAINRVTNANIYLDGKSLLGKAEEVTNPVIKSIMSEHKALGMNGKLELPSGIDKLETKIKWSSFYSDVLLKIANPEQAVQLQVRSSVKTFTSAGLTGQVPLAIYMTGTFKEFPTGAFKNNDNVELESSLNLTYLKMVYNGVDIVEIDVLANIHKVNGVDILADYRANLGI